MKVVIIMNNNERYEYIMNDLRNKAEIVKEKGYTLLALFLQGSQNYDLDVYDDDYKSDIDCKAIIIPSFQDIVYDRKPISTTLVLDNNEHIELKDIRIMKDMWLKQNISYIELLYTDFIVYGEYGKEFVDYLLSFRDKIANINKNQFLRCIKGMAMEKLKAMEHHYPTIIDKINKYGYDPKQLHHIMRLYNFVYEYLINERPIKECYKTVHKQILIAVKKGLYDLLTAREMANAYYNELCGICDKSITSVDIVDKESIDKLNEWVYKVLEYYMKKELN